MSPERLEDRTLLAGDLLASGMSPWQNPYQPTDVNFDLETTPLDALIVINSLNNAGPRSLMSASASAQQSDTASGAEGEIDDTSVFVDVNGDSQLTPLDVLTVVNTINQADGEAGDFIEFSKQLTDLNGNPLTDTDQDGVPEIVAGNDFLFQVFVQDRRSPPPRLGVFSAYPIVPVDFTLVSTAYQEVQRVTVDPTATGGTFNVQFGGNTSAQIAVTDLIPSTTSAAALETVLVAIAGIGAGNVEVSRAAYLTFDVVFTGNLANMNVADLVPVNVALTSDGNPIVGNPVTVQETVAADPNSQASFFSAYQSATNLAAGGVENRTYKFSPSGSVDKATPAAGRLMNIGAAASIIQVDQTFEINWAPNEGPTVPSLLFAVRFTADNAGRLTLQPGPPVAGDASTPDELTYWPSSGQSSNDRLNLFPNDLAFVDFDPLNPAVLDIVELATAVGDERTINEDSGPTLIDVLPNDTTVSGTKNLQQIVTPPAGGTAILSGSQISYEPNANFNGQDTFVYRMNDGGVNTDDATVTVNVTAVNDAPEFTPQSTSITIDEDAGGQTVNGWAAGIRPGPTTAVDEVGQVLTFNETLLNPGGDKLQAADFVAVPSVNETTGQLTYQVAPNVNGQAVVQVTLSDNGGTANGGVNTSAAHTLTITVDPINDAPVNTVPGAQNVDTTNLPLVFSTVNSNAISVDDPLDKPYAPGGDVTVEVSFSVVDGTLTLTNTGGLDSVVTAPDSKTVTISGTTTAINTALASSLKYTGPVGQDTLTVTTDDLGNEDKGGSANALTDTDFVTITVAPPTRPFAAPDQEDVIEDSGPTTIDVLANDFDTADPSNQPPGSTVTITDITQPPNGEGTVTIAQDERSVTYTTDQDFSGTTTFTYQITDTITINNDGPSWAMVTVNVDPINDSPTLDAISNQTTAEDTAQTVNLTGISAGPLEDQALTVTATSSNTGLIPNPTVNYTSPGATGSVSYTPVQDQNGGPVTLTVTVTDDGLDGIPGNADDAATSQSFTVNVTPVNDAPEIAAPSTATVAEDGSLPFTGANLVTINDVEDDNVTVTITPTNGTASVTTVSGTVSEVNAAIAGLTYTPTGDYNGSAILTIDADDNGTNGTSSHVVNVTVSEVNDKPTAVNDDPGFTTNEETPKTIAIADLINNDLRGPANESGQTLTITGVNADSQYGTATLNGNVVFDPAQDFVGDATFTYTVEDNGTTNNSPDPLTDVGTVTVTVLGVNDAPVNNLPGNQTTDEDAPFTFSSTNVIPNAITISDADAGSNPVQTAVSVDKSGMLTLPNGTPMASVTLTDTVANINAALNGMTFTPAPGFNSNVDGLITLTVTTSDQGHSEGADNTGTGTPEVTTNSITIEVVDRNDDPLPQDDNVSVAEGGTLTTIDPLADNGNGADSAGPNEDSNQTLTIIGFDATTTRGGTVTANGNGTFTYTPPNIDFNTVDDPPVDTFTYTVEDNGTTLGQPDPKTATGIVTVTVTEVNDNPIAGDDLLLIDPNPQVGQEFTFSVNDVLVNDVPGPANENGQSLSVTAVNGPNVTLNNGTITYTVPNDFNHMDTFTYTVTDNGTTDGSLTPETATGNVTVRDVVLTDVTGYVYDDLNGNGQKNDGEPGIAGVRMTIEGQSLDPNAPFVQEETWTDENGHYIFPGVLPNQDGFRYTLNQTQPEHFADGAETVHSALNNANDQQEATDAIPTGTNDVITVALPLLGYDDGGNDNNNFGEMGLIPDLSSVDYRDLLHSESNNPITDMGMMFAVDANGNLQWKINIGGWNGYVPGEKAIGSNTYQDAGVATTNGNAWRVTNTYGPQVHDIDLGDRVRWGAAGTSKVYRIFGSADYFFAAAEAEGEPIAEDQPVEMLAAAGNAAQYAAAVDAVFAEAAEISA